MKPSFAGLDFVSKNPDRFAIILLVVLILAPYWKAATVQSTFYSEDSFTSDFMNASFPERYAVADAIKNGNLPLWLPQIYGGFPLMAWTEAGVWYPLNLACFLLLPPYAALNWDILLTMIIAACGVYRLLRRFSLRVEAALLGSFAFPFTGFMVAHVRHLSMVQTASWVPYGLLAIEIAFPQSEKDSARPAKLFWLSPVIGLQILAGHPQIVYYSLLIYSSYFTYRLIQNRAGFPIIRALALYVLVLAFGIGVGAVQWIPTYQLSSLSQRSGSLTYEFVSFYAYQPANIMNLVFPYANGDAGNITYRLHSIFWEDYGYAGLIPLILAFVAALTRWRLWRVRFFVYAALVAYCLVLGPATSIFHSVFLWVPGMDYFRCPQRLLLLVDLAICILAAFAVSRPDSEIKTSWRLLTWCLLALTILDLFYFQLRQNRSMELQPWQKPPEMVNRLNPDLDSRRVYSPHVFYTFRSARHQAGGWEGNLEPYIRQREFLQPSTNILYGIRTPDGYAQLAPSPVVDIWGDVDRAGLIARILKPGSVNLTVEPVFQRLMNLFGVKYILSFLPIASDQFQSVGRRDDVFLYQNPSLLPRSFVVTNYKIVRNRYAARVALLAADFDPSRQAILYQSPGFQPVLRPANSKTAILSESNNRIVLKVHSDSPGILVLTDTYYPGWRAQIDGAPSEILEANICQRAVLVPSGDHDVHFIFDPPVFKVGVGVSLISILCLAIAIWKLC